MLCIAASYVLTDMQSHCSYAVKAKKLHITNLVLAYCATALAIALALFIAHVWGMTMDSTRSMEMVWLRGVWFTMFMQIFFWTPAQILWLWLLGPRAHIMGAVLLVVAMALLFLFAFKCPDIVLTGMKADAHKGVCLDLPFQFWIAEVGATNFSATGCFHTRVELVVCACTCVRQMHYMIAYAAGCFIFVFVFVFCFQDWIDMFAPKQNP